MTTKGGLAVVDPAIVSYAVLKVNWDHRDQDYIGSFMPFVVECIKAAPEDTISLADLQNRLLEVFGLRMPFNSVKTIIKRAKRMGYLRIENGVYVRVPERLPDTNFVAKRDRALRELNALVTAFKVFCQERFDLVIEEDKAEGALHTYLTNHSDVVLEAAINGGPVPVTGGIKQSKFLVSSFVWDLHQRDPQLFGYLENVVKGTILANSLVYQDIGKVRNHFSNVEIYFDTTFILYAVGFGREEHRVACRELLDLLVLEGAQLRCFDHTYHEMLDVLHSSSYRLKKGMTGDANATLRFLSTQGWTSSDVEALIGELPNLLRQLRISVKPHPEYTQALGIDEAALKTSLENIYTSNSPDETVERDIASVTAIYRLRDGRPMLELERCKALFVTTNASLVRVANDFFGTNQPIGNAPIAITDTILTHLVWLKQPNAAPELPRKRVIANCFAALEPAESLWKRYLEAIADLKEKGTVTPDQYAVLRYSLDARTALMELTLGEPSAFSEGTVQEVLRVAEENIRAKAEADAAEERRKREQTETRLARIRQKHRSVLSRLESAALDIARIVARTLLVVIALLCVFGAYFTSPFYENSPFSGWWSLIVPGIQIIALVLGLVDWVFGLSINQLVLKVEVWIHRRLTGRLQAFYLSWFSTLDEDDQAA